MKLFVGGIPQEVDEEEFEEHFKQFGEVTDCVLLPKQPGRDEDDKFCWDFNSDKGCGRDNCPWIHEKKEPKEEDEEDEDEEEPTGHRGYGFVQYKLDEIAQAVLEQEHTLGDKKLNVSKAEPKPKELFVGGFDEDMTKEILKEYFDQFGEVTDVLVFPARGYGFVTILDDGENVRLILQMRKHEIGDTTVNVNHAKNQNQNQNKWSGGGNNNSAPNPFAAWANSSDPKMQAWAQWANYFRMMFGGGMPGGNSGGGKDWGPGRDNNDKTCWDFNSPRGCNRENCNWLHVKKGTQKFAPYAGASASSTAVKKEKEKQADEAEEEEE